MVFWSKKCKENSYQLHNKFKQYKKITKCVHYNENHQLLYHVLEKKSKFVNTMEKPNIVEHHWGVSVLLFERYIWLVKLKFKEYHLHGQNCISIAKTRWIF